MPPSTTTLPWHPYHRLSPQVPAIPLQTPRPCPLAGHASEVEVFRLEDFQFFNDQDGRNRVTHRVVLCQDCGILYTNPCYTPDGFARLFEKAGRSYGHHTGRMEEEAQWVTAHVPEAALVWDIGCGTGAFLRALPETMTCMGLDIDAPSIETARTLAPDISFHCIDFARALPPEAPPDLMTMFHVLEHLPDPLATLTTLRQAAGLATRLLVEVPILERAVTEPSGDCVGFWTVQHLTHFSRPTLHAMLARAGWQVTVTDDRPGYNGYRILATPADPVSETLLERARQTQADLARAYHTGWQQGVYALQARLAKVPQDADVLIWGGGQHTEYLTHLTDLFSPSRRFLIVDQDPAKHGTTLHGIPILSPETLSPAQWTSEGFWVVLSSYAWQTQIHETLLSWGVSPSRLVTLYDTIMAY